MSPAYVDSSALVKLIRREPETDALRAYLTSAGPLASSIVATVEVSRAIARGAPELISSIPAVIGMLVLLPFDSRLAARAAAVGPAGLRTLDAIHLASAVELGDELTAFVSYDARLSAAARDLGLSVVAPGGS